MTSPVKLAVAAALLCAAAQAHGWASASYGLLLLVVASAVLIRVSARTRTIVRQNTPEPLKGTRRVANLIVSVAAAVAGSETARGLALEAQATLDELAAEPSSGWTLVSEALLFALRLPAQIAARRRSEPCVPDLSTEDEASDSRPATAKKKGGFELVPVDLGNGVVEDYLLPSHLVRLMQAPQNTFVIRHLGNRLVVRVETRRDSRILGVHEYVTFSPKGRKRPAH